MSDRYRARINGFALDVETLEDTFEKAIARYEYPFRDGAETEDMGQKARGVKVRCYFIGESYQAHGEFVESLKTRELSEFHHPKYGLLTGRVESVSIRHNDRTETAEVDVAFVQDLLSQEEPARMVDVGAAAEEAFTEGQEELKEEIAGDARGKLGSEAEEILEKDLDPALGIVEQFSGVSLTARDYLKSVEAYVGTLEAELAEIANPANSMIAAINYGVNLPGRVAGALARTVERTALLRESLKSAPARFIDSLKMGLKELETASAGFSLFTLIGSSQRLALEAADLYSADEQSRQKLRRAEQTRSFDALGNYTPPEAGEPVMTVRDLERSLATVRGELQSAIDQARSVESLKAMARELLEHVNLVKLERDRIVTVTLDNSMPLHLVCLKYGLSYSYAARILAINNIPHPSFANGEVSIYAR